MKRQLIIGPPGTGKTTTLLNIVQEKLDEGYAPEEIAYVSFTRKAAYEARDRALEKFNHLHKNSFKHFRTLHSLAYQSLSLTNGDVMTDEHIRNVADSAGLEFKNTRFIGGYSSGSRDGAIGDKCLFLYGLAQNKMVDPVKGYEHLIPIDMRWEMPFPQYKRFVLAYDLYRQETGLLDFSDMLEEASKDGPLRGVKIAIIDEAQDLTKLQWRYVDSIFPNVEEMFIAGDDDQAIYDWSGADIDRFRSEVNTAKSIVLDHSYRLPEAVFQFSNQIGNKIYGRLPKTWTHNGQGGTVRSHAQLQKVPFLENKTDWLVLVRNNYQKKEIRQILIDMGVAFHDNDKKFVSPNELKAIRCWVRLQKGESLTASQARLMYKYMMPRHQFDPELYPNLERSVEKEIDLNMLQKHFGLIVSTETDWWSALPGLDKKGAHGKNFEKRGYIKRALSQGENLDTPRVALSTIHGAKGGEADNVLLLGDMSARTMKHFQNDRENKGSSEHRVFYVGASRAKKELHIMPTDHRRGYPFPGISRR